MNDDLVSEVAKEFSNEVGQEIAKLFDRFVKQHNSMRVERHVGFGYACLRAAVATYLSPKRGFALKDVPAVAEAAYDAMAAKAKELEASR